MFSSQCLVYRVAQKKQYLDKDISKYTMNKYIDTCNLKLNTCKSLSHSYWTIYSLSISSYYIIYLMSIPVHSYCIYYYVSIFFYYVSYFLDNYALKFEPIISLVSV